MASTPDSSEALRHFLVELPSFDGRWDQVADLTARARQAATRLRRQGTDVRFVRSVYAPESDSLFLVYQATSEDAVAVAAGDANLGTARVSAAISGDIDAPAAGGQPMT